MKKYILFLFLMLIATGGFAQSTMSDTQVLQMIMKEYNSGSSQAQIVTKLMQSGVDISQIRRVRSMYERMQSGSGMGTTSTKSATDNRTRSRAASTKNMTAKQREDATIQDYDDEQREASKYSNYRLQRQRTAGDENTYNEDDEQFVLMKDEMDDWLPGDTAAMYRQLVKQMKKEKATKKVFGRDIFNNKDLSFEPNLNIATPANYHLGPGDAVYIDIYGASQKSVESTVTPDGYINIEGYGPIYVSGMTVAQANARVRAKLGKRYSSSKIRLSVGETRSIVVNVMGEVKAPGTYTLSAFSTVFNALYLAGGIGNLGTLRNIKVYRSNRLVSTIDVYDFILNGKAKGNIRLADNDVIVVGPYDCLVNITGKVKRPMYYEMKRGESISTLLRYAGGFTGDAYTKSVRVRRKTGREYSIYNVNEFDMSSFRLSDDDSVSVDSVLSRYENMAQVKGAVFRPGMYQVGAEINSVRTLIEAAEGLTEQAFTARAVMHRMKSDRTLKVIPVDIEGIMKGTSPDIPLQNEDVLFIPTKQDVQEEQTITIHGEVQYPGVYKYADNETLEDFVLQAGGLKNTASTVKVDVARRITNPKALTNDSIVARTYSFSLRDGFVIDGKPGFTLQPYDEVYVRKSPGTTKQQNVTVEGEVMFAGTYALPKSNSRLSDIIKACGGLNNLAYAQGARLERTINTAERARMEAVLNKQKEDEQKNLVEMAARSSNASTVAQAMQQGQSTQMQKFNIGNTYYVGIELDKALAHPGSDADIILREGDRILIPQYSGTVKINGEVMYPNTVGYVPGKNVSYYIDQAGGFSSNAKKKNSYIIYMNGMVAKVGHNAKPRPGCEIVVPSKVRNTMSIAETMSIGTSVASIATMIATLANIIK